MAATRHDAPPGLIKGLGLLDATTIVMGSMIGSGILDGDFVIAVQQPTARPPQRPRAEDLQLSLF